MIIPTFWLSIKLMTIQIFAEWYQTFIVLGIFLLGLIIGAKIKKR